MSFILAKKIEMSQVFDKKGNVVPVCLVEAGPCFVTQVKTKEPSSASASVKTSAGKKAAEGKKDGYEAVQIGFEKKKDKKIKKSEKGKGYKYLKEFRVESSKFKIGQKIDVSQFKAGDKVKVSGISKGKGFQGGVKRWGFHGKSATHGTKHEQRTIGSVGATGPARVFKGKKMPGRMGADRITVTNLEIVKVDEKNNLLAIKGAIPGRRGTLLEIQG